MLKNENIVDNIMIFSHQSSVNEYISILQPNQMNKIKNVFGKDDIKKILESQSKPNAKPLLIILDDVIYPTSLVNNKEFSLMMMNSRHYNIYTILTMQYPFGLSQILFYFSYIFVLFYNMTVN